MIERRKEASVKEIVTGVIAELFAKDGFLLEANVAERTIAARIATYLEGHFPNHQVNVEYNRHGLHPKRLNLPGFEGEKLILPDLVIHQQGHDNENVLVIQVKKETNKESREYDRAVIAAMQKDYGYTWGLLIDLPAGPGATKRDARLEWQ